MRLEMGYSIALEGNVPGRGAVKSIDHIEKGRFTGPIRTDETQDLSCVHCEGDMAESPESSEEL
jgi:hypothetical protein